MDPRSEAIQLIEAAKTRALVRADQREMLKTARNLEETSVFDARCQESTHYIIQMASCINALALQGRKVQDENFAALLKALEKEWIFFRDNMQDDLVRAKNHFQEQGVEWEARIQERNEVLSQLDQALKENVFFRNASGGVIKTLKTESEEMRIAEPTIEKIAPVSQSVKEEKKEDFSKNLIHLLEETLEASKKAHLITGGGKHKNQIAGYIDRLQRGEHYTSILKEMKTEYESKALEFKEAASKQAKIFGMFKAKEKDYAKKLDPLDAYAVMLQNEKGHAYHKQARIILLSFDQIKENPASQKEYLKEESKASLQRRSSR